MMSYILFNYWPYRRRVPRRTTWTQCIILPGTHRFARRMRVSLGTYFNSSPTYHLYVLFVEISYHARFCLQIFYPEILFTMLKVFLNRGSFIVHVLLLGTSKAFTLSVFLPGVHVHVVPPGTQQYKDCKSLVPRTCGLQGTLLNNELSSDMRYQFLITLEANFPVPFSFMCCSMERTTIYNELDYSEILVIIRLFFTNPWK